MFGKIVYKYLNLDYIQRYKSALSIISGGNRDEIPCKFEKSGNRMFTDNVNPGWTTVCNLVR